MANCPRCGARAAGNFCSSCGASLGKRPCPSCGAVPDEGARFCNQCGHALDGGEALRAQAGGGRGATPARIRGGGRSGSRRARPAEPGDAAAVSRIGWLVGGAFMVGIVLILALPILRREEGANAPFAPAGSGAPAASAGAPPDISDMTPREAADRLFDRVMRAEAAGDVQQVETFLPMAIAAHDRARPLDPDGLFHLSLLYQAANDFDGALNAAAEILARDPDHLLGLMSAGESSRRGGDPTTAREYAERFLDVYDAQLARGLEEYDAHSDLLLPYRQTARTLTGG